MNKYRRGEISKSLDDIEAIKVKIKRAFLENPPDGSISREEIKEEMKDIASDINGMGNYTILMLDGMFENSIYYDKVENEGDVLMDAGSDLYDIIEMIENSEPITPDTANKLLKDLSKIYDNIQEII